MMVHVRGAAKCGYKKVIIHIVYSDVVVLGVVAVIPLREISGTGN